MPVHKLDAGPYNMRCVKLDMDPLLELSMEP